MNPAGAAEPPARQELIGALSAPGAYPGHVDEVQLLQTPVAVLFFAGDRVYKLRRAVRLEGLDTTTIEERRRHCEEELLLNRRIAPGMYREVLPVTAEEDGRILVNGKGEVIDWVLEMLRLPADRMLGSLLDQGVVGEQQFRELAQVLVEFHGGVTSGPAVNRIGLPRAVGELAREDLERLENLCRGEREVLSALALDFLRARLEHFLEQEHELLELRVAENRIREGHGDLHAGNICLWGEDVFVFDCVEDRRARCGDVAHDLAALAMDLDHRGHSAASDFLMHAYARFSSDDGLERLLPFYKTLRALHRTGVLLCSSREHALDPGRRAASLRKAQRTAQLALGYQLPACLVLCSVPAALRGSSPAAFIAGRLRAAWVRKESAGEQEDERERSAVTSQQGDSAREYGRLLERAFPVLEGGTSVVVEAPFEKTTDRRPFLDAAAAAGLAPFVLHLVQPRPPALATAPRRSSNGRRRGARDEDLRERELAISAAATPEESCHALLERMLELSPVTRSPSGRPRERRQIRDPR